MRMKMFKMMMLNLTTGHQKKPVNGLCSPSSLRSSIITPGSSSKKKLLKIYGKYKNSLAHLIVLLQATA